MNERVEADHLETRAAYELVNEVEIMAAKIKLAGAVILLVFLAVLAALADAP